MLTKGIPDQSLTDPAAILSLIAALQSSRRARDSHGLFFIEGVRNFIACADQGWPIHTLVYSERLLTAVLARRLVRHLKRADVPFLRLSPEQFRAISQAERASGVAAIVQ